MQITPELLRKYADDAVEKLVGDDYNILAVYLTGTMVTGDTPFLGGTMDIDLVFIHLGQPQISREIQKVNDEIHLDISHQPQRDYSDRLALRTDPWLGPCLAEAVALYDPQHFIDLTQASVRGLFNRPGNILRRAKGQIENARDEWYKIRPLPNIPGPHEVMDYLSILDSACNAVSLLVSDPLTERRFLANFNERAKRIGHPGLYPGILGMLGSLNTNKENLVSWVQEWGSTYKNLPEKGRHPRLHPFRYSYYFKAFDFILEGDHPEDILWPLLRTWTLGAGYLSESDPGFLSWQSALSQLGLLGDGLAQRITALDAFLEQIEGAIADWGVKEGA